MPVKKFLVETDIWNATKGGFEYCIPVVSSYTLRILRLPTEFFLPITNNEYLRENFSTVYLDPEYSSIFGIKVGRTRDPVWKLFRING
jgi:hypothetical protein